MAHGAWPWHWAAHLMSTPPADPANLGSQGWPSDLAADLMGFPWEPPKQSSTDHKKQRKTINKPYKTTKDYYLKHIYGKNCTFKTTLRNL